jgi:hypothetical protein
VTEPAEASFGEEKAQASLRTPKAALIAQQENPQARWFETTKKPRV